MNPTIKARIESIRRGEVPEGYKRTKIGIVPNEWKEYNLGDFLEEYKEKTIIPNQYPVLTSSRKGLMLQKKYYSQRQVTTDDNIGYNVIPLGFITYRSRSDDGRFCFNENTIIEKGIISYFYPVFSVSANAVKTFVLYLMNETIYRRMIPYAEGTAQQVLSLKQLCSLKYFFPTVSEQEKIAEILAGQDRVIALKEKLLVEKQKQKKYLMQQLLTGKKRLPGFSGEWKCVRLGELGCFYPGLSGKTKEDFGSGKPYIPYKNIFNNPKIDCDFFEYVKIKENEKQTKVRYGDIFFTTSSEILSEVGMTSVMLDSVEELYLNSFCTGFRLYDFNLIHPEYASHYFRGEEFRIALNKISQGITRFNLSKNGLSKISLTLPSIEEQLAIAQILSTVDKEIELLEKDIEQEKLKKKSLMQLLLTGIVRVDELVS